MKSFKKSLIGMLLMMTLLFVTACGNNGNTTTNDTNDTDTAQDANADDNGVNIDDILFDTDGDGIYDHTDVDGDGLLEEIGKDANDVVDDLVNDVTGEGDTLVDDGVVGDGVDGVDDVNGVNDNMTTDGGNVTNTP